MRTLFNSPLGPVLVDDNDYDILRDFDWYVGYEGYVYKKGGFKRLHSILMGKMSGKVIDHKDRNKLNNQRSNLRFVTRQQNCLNNKFRSIPYYGIEVYSGSGFRVQLRRHGKALHLGVYKKLEDAQRARDEFLEEEQNVLST